MITDAVGDGAGLIIEGAPALYTEIFRHRYLHALDIVAIPECLHERICEAEGNHVIHRPLAQIVVDPEDCTFIELSEKDFIELLRRCQVMPERLLAIDPTSHRAPTVL